MTNIPVEKNYLYVYDLPKKDVSSIKLAESFKDLGVDIGTRKPQIQRDLFKPYYSAVIYIEKSEDFVKAKDQMKKYFNIEGQSVRYLPFDKDLKGEGKLKMMNRTIFYKFPQDQDKALLTYDHIYDKFG